MKKDWHKTPMGNVVLDGEGFYISYNVNPTFMLSFFDSNDGSDETALANRDNGAFYVLNGDFREQFEEAFDKGYEACYDLYLKLKPYHQSTWASDYGEETA